ncbi:MAG TPA: hypothetical protein VK741_31850 [Acetobacteraceae bacterium]|jgi:hypothetical protein|nr:hypothetical protein [Acetobacteraceae bacterium]
MLRYVGGASTDLIPNLQRCDNPMSLLSQQIELQVEPHVQIGG